MKHRVVLLGLALSTALLSPALAQAAGAKNVILMISDGIGFNGWLATDYYQGRAGSQSYQRGRPDGTEPVMFGQAHWAVNLVDQAGRVLPGNAPIETAVGVVDQYYDPTTRWNRFENTFRNYTDSASAGTALMAGRKTVNGRLNKDWSAEIDYRTIAEIADAQGRATGAVSTVMASHATPAAVWAHNVSRRNYDEIFNEMVKSGLDVIMGGGHPDFDRSGRPLEEGAEREFRFVGGEATWNMLTGQGGLNGFAFIDEKAEFEALAAGKDLPEKVVGIFQTISTTQAGRDDLPADDTNPSGMAFIENVPALATMTIGALNVLNQNQNGFFLMSEGGAVDWMGHANDMPRYIEEQVDFNEAVDAVIGWVEANSSWDETLLIVTSDHETGGIWGEGTYTNRTGGPVAASRSEEDVEAARFNPAADTFNGYFAVQNRGAGNLPGFQFASGSHTNELVPLWAIGVGSERFAPFARVDVRAAELWGEPYGWDGAFVDNTAVFHVMNEALSERAVSAILAQ